ncbi:MAG: exonuclease SbcCD subunit D [Bacteroidia bacterium]|jgi:exonuclease SbcD|nr:exonuclease SbcCD subunit D [Bacteroidia bacterium]GIV23002.1 MAG: nuclease SbcCD subunit D [Bacteroidia bacterium]
MAGVFRFLHTADWHLGKRWLQNRSRLEEQEAVLENLIRIAEEEQVHAVVIAGDIFDSPRRQPAEVVSLFTRTLLRLAAEGERVVIAIAGNHDSPEYLNALAPWGAQLGILLAGRLPNSPTDWPTTVGKASLRAYTPNLVEIEHPRWPFPVRFLLAPFLGRYDLPHAYKDLPHYWQELWQQTLAQLKTFAPIILVSHLYLSLEDPLEEDEEERSLQGLGGSEPIPLSAFPAGLAYGALGHIHRPYQIQNGYPMAYAGSLMQYSFGDKIEEKSAWLVEVTSAGEARLTPHRLRGARPVRTLPAASFEEACQRLETHKEAYVRLLWRGNALLSYAQQNQLKAIHPYFDPAFTLVIERALSAYEGAEEASLAHTPLPASIEDAFIAYYRFKTGAEPPQELLAIFREVLDEAEKTSNE